jgi:6-pyruvoyltetrahydropterin/6-carboxytetrahydropterin synthase
MFTTTVRTDFLAQHFLTVPDPGPEGETHTHHYEVEAAFSGPELNEFDYLVDIDDVERALQAVEDRYRDHLLNDQPAFEDANPSVEHFARVIHGQVAEMITDETVAELAVTVWEDQNAAAEYAAPV